MVESLSMHHFPVVDQDQRLVGVVSETDLILEARNRSRGREEGSHRESTTVKDIFTGHLVTVDQLASPRHALKLLMDNYIRSLPVMAEGKLVGIVTDTDFLREFSYGQMTCAKEPVSDFLEPPAEPLDPDTTADEALAALKKSGSDHLAVVQGAAPSASSRDARSSNPSRWKVRSKNSREAARSSNSSTRLPSSVPANG